MPPPQPPPEHPDCPRQPLQVEGLWPYWLPAGAAATTVNSFSMDSLFILTGPNMAGKSTLLRATCALAVLSACGLYAPVKAATVPYFDAFVLRNFSADSPIEGKSSFAMEMSEMRYVGRCWLRVQGCRLSGSCLLCAVSGVVRQGVESHWSNYTGVCRSLLDAATADTLALVDELGKGTEVG